jgi:hypothetical protein
LGVFRDSPISCAVDNAYLDVMDASGNVYAVAKAGGTPKLLQAGTPNPVTSPGITNDGLGSVFFGEGQEILLANSSGTGNILPIALDGVMNATLIAPVSLAVDAMAGELYWADWGTGKKNDGAIGRVGTNAASPSLLASSLATPQAITVSGNDVYWLSAGQLLSTTSTTTAYVQVNTGKLWRTHK